MTSETFTGAVAIFFVGSQSRCFAPFYRSLSYQKSKRSSAFCVERSNRRNEGKFSNQFSLNL
jgi:hypothetical protein